MRSFLTWLVIFSFSVIHISSAQKISWYKCLKGTIDKYPVTMHLHKTDHTYAGYYFYDNKEQPIQFYGEDTTIENHIKLFAFSGTGDDYETFVFASTGEGYSGKWRKGDSGKALIFTATQLQDTSLVPFEMVYVYGEASLRQGMQESPQAAYEVATVWPVENSPTADLMKETIIKEFDTANSSDNIEDILLHQKNQYLNDYQNEYMDAEEKDIHERPFSFSMEQTKKLMILFQSSKMVSLADYLFAYTGGAHGNYGTGFVPLDLLHRKKIMIDDVFSTEGKQLLPQLLEKYFRTNRNISSTVSLKEAGLFEDKIEPTENFFITNKGIGFSYTPYEIAPYAMGEVAIFIPFVDIANYLQPSFKNLIH